MPDIFIYGAGQLAGTPYLAELTRALKIEVPRVEKFGVEGHQVKPWYPLDGSRPADFDGQVTVFSPGLFQRDTRTKRVMEEYARVVLSCVAAVFTRHLPGFDPDLLTMYTIPHSDGAVFLPWRDVANKA